MNHPEPSTDFRAVGVDIFAGGFTVGVARHFRVEAQLEEGDFGVATFRRNFPHVPVTVGHGSWPVVGSVDLMYGNPPCSPWSSVGRSMRRGRDSWRTDPNVEYARRYLEYGLRNRPKVWVLESVPPIQKSEFLLDVGQTWLDAGYAFTLVRQDAKFWGLPQQRRRCFLVAHTVAVDWQHHVDPLDKPVTAGEVLETVPTAGVVDPLNYDLDELLPDLGYGGNLRDLWSSRNAHVIEATPPGQPVPGRPVLMTHRIKPDKASCTVVGQNSYIHPFEHRPIGHLEAARLCGYPDDYEWDPSAGYLLAQIAKSVTPPAGEFLAWNVARALTADVPVEPASRRRTFWASSTRVDDYRAQDLDEPFPLDHACTLETDDAASSRPDDRAGDPPVVHDAPHLAAPGDRRLGDEPAAPADAPAGDGAPYVQLSLWGPGLLPDVGGSPTVGPGGPRRALITGCTPLQVNSPARKSDYLSMPHAMRAALESAGWHVDWGRPELGWQALDGGDPYDLTLIGWTDLESLSANRAYDAAYLYERLLAEGRPVAFYHDDWQVHTCLNTFVRYAGGHRKVAAPSHNDRERARLQSPEQHHALVRMLERLLVPESWPAFLVPTLDAVDPTRLVANPRWPLERVTPWAQVAFYPTFEERRVPGPRPESWSFTTLFYGHAAWVETLGLTWPVQTVGGPGQANVPEAESVEVIAATLGTISPPHNRVVNDGWARSRHWFAAHLGTVVAGDPRELGDWASAFALTPREVELLTPGQRERLVLDQRDQYLALVPPRDELVARLVALAGEASAVAAARQMALQPRPAPVRVLTPTPVPEAPPAAAPKARGGPRVATEYKALPITDDDAVLDIGAHRGEFLRYVRSVAPTAAVFSFEPDPDNFAALREAAVGLRARALVKCAVTANGQSTADLWRCNGSDTSMHSLLAKRGRTAVQVLTVPLERVYADTRPTVVKLAVEGYETALVEAAPFPDTVRAVAIKFHPSTAESRDRARTTVAAVEAQGFRAVAPPQLERGSWPVVGVWTRGEDA